MRLWYCSKDFGHWLVPSLFRAIKECCVHCCLLITNYKIAFVAQVNPRNARLPKWLGTEPESLILSPKTPPNLKKIRATWRLTAVLQLHIVVQSSKSCQTFMEYLPVCGKNFKKCSKNAKQDPKHNDHVNEPFSFTKIWYEIIKISL